MADKAKEKQIEPLTIYEKLHIIQIDIKSPKDQKAKNYNYRSAENIIAALKPYLEKYELLLLIDDDLVLIGDRYYVKSTATLKNVSDEQEVSAKAFAREQENISIMSQGQLSGATSSFARKYALGALLGIDDTEDLDKRIDDDRKKEKDGKAERVLSDKQINRFYAIAKSKNISEQVAMETVEKKYGVLPTQMSRAQYDEVCKSLEAKKG